MSNKIKIIPISSSERVEVRKFAIQKALESNDINYKDARETLSVAKLFEAYILNSGEVEDANEETLVYEAIESENSKHNLYPTFKKVLAGKKKFYTIQLPDNTTPEEFQEIMNGLMEKFKTKGA